MQNKKILLLLLMCSFLLFGCATNNTETEVNNYLRIHIRANSNLEVDQNIKYEIKDEVVKFLTPLVANVTTKQGAMNMINSNKTEIENVANSVLKKHNFNYVANMNVLKEFFPTRVYGQYSLPANVYDAVVLNLGEAEGDNWWCVVYPPLCFVGEENANLAGIKYKSKLWEIIVKFFNK